MSPEVENFARETGLSLPYASSCWNQSGGSRLLALCYFVQNRFRLPLEAQIDLPQVKSINTELEACYAAVESLRHLFPAESSETSLWSHFTSEGGVPLLFHPIFCSTELASPFFLNCGLSSRWLLHHRKELRNWAQRWVLPSEEGEGVDKKSPKTLPSIPPRRQEEMERILTADATRTFTTTLFQSSFRTFLHLLWCDAERFRKEEMETLSHQIEGNVHPSSHPPLSWGQTGEAYAQAQAPVAAFTLLLWTPREARLLLRDLRLRLLPGHWQHEAWGYALLSAAFTLSLRTTPLQKLQSPHVRLETCLRRAFASLGVHLFDWDFLILFWEGLRREALTFLFRFWRHFLLNFSEEVHSSLSSSQLQKGGGQLHALLRLDPAYVSRERLAVVFRSTFAHHREGPSEVELQTWRRQAGLELCVLLERKKQAEEEEGGGGEPCEICEVREPQWFCATSCGKLCEPCTVKYCARDHRREIW